MPPRSERAGTGPAPRRHYLDHASTSPLRPEVVGALEAWLRGPAGDPGRLHHEGGLVRAALEEARAQVAELLGVRPRQVVFTSGATESVHAAVWGATRARPGPVLRADVEHSAVRQASDRWGTRDAGASPPALPVDGAGRIDPDGVADALARRAPDLPALVHCQWANHEVGTVQPVGRVLEVCRSAGVPVHVDASAAVGQVDLDLGRLDPDLVSVGAHTMGGPPGVGALVVRRGLRLDPLLVGGAQERGRRAGMENVPGIVGFGAAAAALTGGVPRRLEDEGRRARARIAHVVAAGLDVGGVAVVGDPDPAGRLPHLVCLGVDGVEAEPVLLGLDRAGIAVHSGSACASEALEPSPVLEAMGVDPSRSLRVSVGWSSTDADVAAFAGAFGRVVTGLRALRG